MPVYDESVDELAAKYQHRRRVAEEEQPYWLSVRQPRDGEMEYALFDYWPDWHYREAIDQLREQDRERVQEYGLEPDGGRTELHKGPRNAHVYYWLNPRTGAALYHTTANGEEADPFFGDQNEAVDFLERRDDMRDDDQLEGMSLYKAKTRKVLDAKDVVTEQAGLDAFDPR